MKKIIALLLTMSIALSLFACIVVRADTELIGTPDRAEYKNAGPNTIVTIRFNKPLAAMPTIRVRPASDMSTALGTAYTTNKLSADGKTVTIDLGRSVFDNKFVDNTEYIVQVYGLEATDGTTASMITIPLTTRDFEHNYIIDDMEGYAIGDIWSDATENTTAKNYKWTLTPYFIINKASPVAVKNADGTKTYTYAELKSATSPLELNDGKSYSNLFSDLEIGIVDDPDSSVLDNKVLKYAAGTTNKSNFTDDTSALFVRLVRGRNNETGKFNNDGFAYDKTKKFVQRYRIYIDGVSVNHLNTDGTVNGFIYPGAIGSNSNAADKVMGMRLFKSSASQPALRIRWNGSATSLTYYNLNAGEWNDIEYIVDPTNSNKYKVRINGEYISDAWATAYGDFTNYTGFSFALFEKYNAGINPTMYIDDLRSFSLEALTAMDGTFCTTDALDQDEDKVVINFTNAVKAADVESAITISDGANAVSKENIVVEMADSNTTAIIDLSALNLETNKSYTISLADTMADEYEQPLSNAATFEIPFTISQVSQRDDVYVSAYENVNVTSAQVTANVTVTNPTSEPRDVWFIVAAYDQYNEMLGVFSQKFTQMSANTNSGPISVLITPVSGATFEKTVKNIKAFVWDSSENMRPYAPAQLLND